MGAYESAFYGGEISHTPSDNYLHIHSCGYYKELALADTKGVFRENGFSDYQLIYILSGSMRFLVCGETKILSEGDVFVYPPNAPQKYKCVSEPGVSYVWVHFSGTAAREILNAASIAENEVYHAQVDEEAYSFINAMAQEMKIRRQGSEMRTNGIFLELLALLSRKGENERSTEKKYSKIMPALKDMEEGARRRTNEEYAALCGLDVYYFIHLFKEVTKTSPIKYVSDALIRRAEGLLTDTNMEISDIARFLGYESPSYFSKRFKEHYKRTPTEHRMLKTNENERK